MNKNYVASKVTMQCGSCQTSTLSCASANGRFADEGVRMVNVPDSSGKVFIPCSALSKKPIKSMNEKKGRILDQNNLAIAGMVPMSTVDWPGNLCCTLFLQGCPWRCTYCHNYEILDPKTPGKVPFSHVVSFLEKRKNLLDGVVFSGGEATRQEELLLAIKTVKEMGFKIGLHTAGIYPKKLQKLINYVDWVGIDIKALPEDYSQVVGRNNSGQKAYESLRIVLDAQVPYEVRLTICPDSVTSDRAFDIAQRCFSLGVRNFALQQARDLGTRDEFVAVAKGWDEQFNRIATKIDGLNFNSYEIRAA